MVVEISSAELFAQTVNIMAECVPVGVPVIAPVAVLKERPGIEEGTSGVIPQLSGAPPALVGVTPLTRLFLVNVNGEPAYEMLGASMTISVNVSVVVAPKAVTVTVCVVLAWPSVGVPEMVPLRQFIIKPSGSSGDTSKIGLVARLGPKP